MNNAETLQKVANFCLRLANLDPLDFCDGLRNEFPDYQFQIASGEIIVLPIQ